MASGQELAQYYVQIIPTTEGIGRRITSAIDAEDVGTKAGASIGEKIKKAIVGLGIGKVIANTIKEGLAAGGNLEQTLGGIDQIFGEGSAAAEQLKKNAQEAFSFAQVSANDYLDQVTSFSAKLMQGLGGDTEATVKYADMAIRQMSDNANTFGTDISSIQSAYQGFAKNNYTMLDNLKLGYGGTASEMARLINDSGVMGETFKATANNINQVSFDKIIEAIQVVQDNMNITGKAAAEASNTLQGSAAALKSSWTNLLADLAIGENVDTALKGVTTSFVSWAGNALKMVANILKGLPGAIMEAVNEALPTVLGAGTDLMQKIADGAETKIPEIIDKASDMIKQFIGTIIDNLPNIIKSGSNMLVSLVKGITKAIPGFIKLCVEVATSFFKTILDNLPEVLKAGVELVENLVVGIVNSIPSLVSGVFKLISNVWDMIKNTNWLQLGKDIITVLINGIKAMFSAIGTTAKSLADTVKDTIKNVNWLQLGKDIVTAIINGLKNMLTSIGSAAKSLADTALEKIKGTDFFSVGKEITSKIKDGMNNLKDSISTVAKTIASNIKSGLNGENWSSIGYNMMAGVESGIASKAAGLASAARSAVTGAYYAAKSALRIDSPSKKFAELGEYVDLGFAGGITDNLKPIEASMKRMYDSIYEPYPVIDVPAQMFGQPASNETANTIGTVTINVNAKDGQSAREIAQEVSDILTRQVIQRKAVFG